MSNHKLAEWVSRYLPCEIGGWVGELGGAAVTSWLTGSFAAAVIAGTIGASVGYYGTAYAYSMRWACRVHCGKPWRRRVVVANLVSLRGITVEFGPAEAIDSAIIRPITLYGGPVVLGNVMVGWIVGSVVADIAFYIIAIFSYERFSGSLAGRNRPSKSLPMAPSAVC